MEIIKSIKPIYEIQDIIKDNVNKKYGRLTIIDVDKIKRYPYYICECECGSEPKSINLNNLKNGGTKSCGCIKLEKYIKKDLENINKKYGMLTVIFRNIEDNRGGVYYWCQCDCGSPLKSISLNNLKKGCTLSCGCYAKEMVSKRFKKYNTYDLTDEFGIGYTFKNEPFYFDLKNYDKIKDYCWYKTIDKYIASYIDRKTLMLHRFIMNPKDSEVVDHINGYESRNDNREYNLRVCNHQENSRNRKNAKGIHFDKDRNKWRAQIWTGTKKLYLGLYEKEEDALEVRREAELKYFGEFAAIKGENSD